MKTLIVGLGNVGTVHGWALSQAGVDITHWCGRGELNPHGREPTGP